MQLHDGFSLHESQIEARVKPKTFLLIDDDTELKQAKSKGKAELVALQTTTYCVMDSLLPEGQRQYHLSTLVAPLTCDLGSRSSTVWMLNKSAGHASLQQASHILP
jgi:hypothetical protein